MLLEDEDGFVVSKESIAKQETTPNQSLADPIEAIVDPLDDWSDGDPRAKAEEIIEIDVENPDYDIENQDWLRLARKKVKSDE